MSEEQQDWVENSTISQERVDLIEQHRVYNDMRHKSDDLLVKVSEEWDKLVQMCPHDAEDLVHKQSYDSGGYDYTGTTNYWDECQMCHTRVNPTSKSDGYYG